MLWEWSKWSMCKCRRGDTSWRKAELSRCRQPESGRDRCSIMLSSIDAQKTGRAASANLSSRTLLWTGTQGLAVGSTEGGSKKMADMCPSCFRGCQSFVRHTEALLALHALSSSIHLGMKLNSCYSSSQVDGHSIQGT